MFKRVLLAVIIVVGGFLAWYDLKPMPNVHALDQIVITDKADEDCTGHETTGRCADKCPEGSYNIGFDEQTGAAICKRNPTGCPYSENAPLGPECDKAKPAEVTSDPVPDTELPQFVGK